MTKRDRNWIIKGTDANGETVYLHGTHGSWTKDKELAYGWHYKREAGQFGELARGIDITNRAVVRRHEG